VAADPKSVVNGTRKFNPAQPWRIEDSLDLYHVNAWGKGYFSINSSGHVVVRPDTTERHEIDLYEVVEGLKARDLTTPVVVRFSDILAHRLRRIHEAFAQAITENDYRNRYAAVFPIKVNQQRLVVEEVYRYGKEFGFGLEVGSKPELLAVMAMTENASERLIICNGFKDDSYIEAVTLATKLGRTIIPVVENFEELGLILKHAEAYQVRPRIGVRVKLFTEGSGRWSASAGEKSKFGLFITEILELFNVLKSRDMLDCLQLVHCHPGSQLQDIRRIKEAINELAHVYAELKLMGAGLQYIDVGGGLGVDYDGSGTNFASSMNYTLNEYASDVVYRVANVCNARDIPHPMIISESGRAVAAYHSVLIFDALGSSALDKFRVTGDRAEDFNGAEEPPQPVLDLFEAYRTVSERVLVECYHDALTAREQVQQMFNLGLLSLEFRGLAERLYWATCAKIRDSCRKLERLPEELEDLESILSRHLFLQLLRVSVAARQLGDRPALSHHADPSSRRAPHAHRRACGHHLRFRRQDRQIRIAARREACARTARAHPWAGVLPRRFPGRRLSGDARRSAQSVRRHARHPHPPA
jgi:arginine decarboxylase